MTLTTAEEAFVIKHWQKAKTEENPIVIDWRDEIGYFPTCLECEESCIYDVEGKTPLT